MQGWGFGGGLIAADSPLKEKPNVAGWGLLRMSGCLGDANEKQAWARSQNPHGLSYLPPLPLPLPSHHQPQIKLPEYL